MAKFYSKYFTIWCVLMTVILTSNVHLVCVCFWVTDFVVLMTRIPATECLVLLNLITPLCFENGLESVWCICFVNIDYCMNTYNMWIIFFLKLVGQNQTKYIVQKEETGVVKQILWRFIGAFCHRCNVWTWKTFYFRWNGNNFLSFI